MKRQVYEGGVRDWFSSDFIGMQNEQYEALESFFKAYGPCIIYGANVEDIGGGVYRLHDGIVNIMQTGNTQQKICRVYEQDIPEANWPIYLTLDTKDRNDVTEYGRVHKDATTRNIVIEYYAKVNTSVPSGNYMKVETNNVLNTTFRDAMQDENYRFLTDALINGYNSHLSSNTNPHSTTKTQVGLGNLPNAKSDSYNLSNSNTLATSKAVRDFYQVFLSTNRCVSTGDYTGALDTILFQSGSIAVTFTKFSAGSYKLNLPAAGRYVCMLQQKNNNLTIRASLDVTGSYFNIVVKDLAGTLINENFTWSIFTT